jgi:putative transcriptional regulator
MALMSDGSGIETPVLLAAMPQVRDPFFHQSVVLLIHHDREGSFGLIVNRPTELLIADILRGMKIDWGGSPRALAYFGGPVRPQLGTVLYSCSAPEVEGVTAAAEIYPGVHTTQHFGDLAALARRPPEHMRLVLGYAGWGEEQLIQEILRNDWITAPVQEDLLFTLEPEGTWERTLRSVGVDPASLPSWTAMSGETAN